MFIVTKMKERTTAKCAKTLDISTENTKVCPQGSPCSSTPPPPPPPPPLARLPQLTLAHYYLLPKTLDVKQFSYRQYVYPPTRPPGLFLPGLSFLSCPRGSIWAASSRRYSRPSEETCRRLFAEPARRKQSMVTVKSCVYRIFST